MNDIITSDLIRGHIDTIILKSLYEGDRYGYDIIKEIEQRTGGEYKLKQPTLYSCLKRLEEQGFTHSYWSDKTAIGGRKKYYTLTDMGRELFVQNQSSWIRSRSIIDSLVAGDSFVFSSFSGGAASNFGENLSASAAKDKDEDIDTAAFFEQAEGEIDSEAERIVAQSAHIPNAAQINNYSPINNESEMQKHGLDSEQNSANFSDTLLGAISDNSDGEGNKNVAGNGDSPAQSYFHSATSATFVAPAIAIANPSTTTVSSYGEAAGSDKDNRFGEIYFEQTDKKSYIDEVASAVYEPRRKTVEQRFDFDDELPYEQHVLKEYGEQSDSIELEPPVQSPASANAAAHSTSGNPAFANSASASASANSTAFGDNSAHSALFSRDYDARESNSTQLKSEVSQFIKYDTSVETLGDLQVVERDYQSALSRLVRQQKPHYSDDPYLQQKLEKTAGAAKQMGDEVVIRRHNDAIREYNSENYYYSGRLKLWQYFIVFCVMLLETMLMFAIEAAVGGIKSGDLWLYITGVLIALALPAVAFLLSVQNYNRRKKNEFEFVSSIVFRLILCALAWVIFFAIAGYRGLFSGKFSDFLASMVYPFILATNLFVSTIVFDFLLKSKKFNC